MLKIFNENEISELTDEEIDRLLIENERESDRMHTKQLASKV